MVLNKIIFNNQEVNKVIVNKNVTYQKEIISVHEMQVTVRTTKCSNIRVEYWQGATNGTTQLDLPDNVFDLEIINPIFTYYVKYANGAVNSGEIKLSSSQYSLNVAKEKVDYTNVKIASVNSSRSGATDVYTILAAQGNYMCPIYIGKDMFAATFNSACSFTLKYKLLEQEGINNIILNTMR